MNMLRQTLGTVAGVAAILMLAAPAQAAEYNLRAAPVNKTMPDGAVMTMWGFALDDDGDFTTIEHEPTVPGPRLTVPAGDTTLTVNLHNALPALNGAPTPVSLVIMGQQAVMNPVSVTDAQGRARVRSFTHETGSGETGIYTWAALQPGTYLYQSGTHPALQVQMGLYGAVTQDAGIGEVYTGLAYQNEVTLLYSEIDPALHTAVAGDNYGPGKAVTSTIDYLPRYFLVNGEPHSPATAPIPAGTAGETLLVRFLNAGLRTHVPVLQGQHMQLVAEDGKPFPYPREQYSALLPAGKTVDAILTPGAEGNYAVYDRRLHLTNGANAQGGLYATLSVQPNVPPTATADTATLDEDTSTVIAVLANDSDAEGAVLVVTAVSMPTANNGSVTINGDNTVTYTPAANYAGDDSFTYSVSDGWSTAVGTVSLTVTPVSDAPVAVADATTTAVDTAATIDVLANDSDVDSMTLVITEVGTPTANGGSVTINADNTVTYVPSAGYVGEDSFAYTVSDGVLTATTNVTVTVQSVQTNTPPTAAADTATMDEDTSAVIAVLANDSDAEGTTLVITAVGTPTANGGSVTINADNTVTYAPAANYVGADSFTYTVSDGEFTADGTVALTVAPVNDAPVAQADLAETAVNTDVMIDVLANDSDVEGDAMTLTGVTSPANGMAMVMGNVIHYQPAADFTGTDSFTYTVSDGAATATASVTVTVGIAANPATLSVQGELIVDKAVFKDKAGTKRDEWMISGQSAVPGSTITLFLGSSPGGTVIGTAVVGADGGWSFQQQATVWPDRSAAISVQSSTGAQLLNVPLTISR